MALFRFISGSPLVHCRHLTSLLCLSDVIVWNCILAYSGTSGSSFSNIKIVVSKKQNPLEKPVPWDHRLTSLGKPCDAEGGPWDGFFYPTLTFMMDSYITLTH